MDLDLSSPLLGLVSRILYALFVTTIDRLPQAPRALRRSRSFSRVEDELVKPLSSAYQNSQAFPPFPLFRAIIHPRARSTPPLGQFVDHYWIASRTTMFKAAIAESPPRSPFIPSLGAAAQCLLPVSEILE